MGKVNEAAYQVALALIAEIEAAIEYYNLIGKTWTGNVIQVRVEEG